MNIHWLSVKWINSTWCYMTILLSSNSLLWHCGQAAIPQSHYWRMHSGLKASAIIVHDECNFSIDALRCANTAISWYESRTNDFNFPIVFPLIISPTSMLSFPVSHCLPFTTKLSIRAWALAPIMSSISLKGDARNMLLHLKRPEPLPPGHPFGRDRDGEGAFWPGGCTPWLKGGLLCARMPYRS